MRKIFYSIGVLITLFLIGCSIDIPSKMGVFCYEEQKNDKTELKCQDPDQWVADGKDLSSCIELDWDAGGMYFCTCYYGLCFKESGSQHPFNCSVIIDPEQKEECYYEMAVVQDDFFSCNSIQDEERRAHSFEKTTEPIFENLSVCDTILNEEYRNRCVSLIGVDQKNDSLCQQITDPELQFLCYFENSVGCSYCEYYPDERYQCYHGCAIARSNMSYCELIPENIAYFGWTLKESCFSELSFNSEICEPCSQISSDQDRFYCYSNCGENLSMDHFSLEICNGFSNVSIKNSCLVLVAKNQRSPELCTTIEHPEVKDKCFYDVALSTENPELCKEIKDVNALPEERTLRDWCIHIIAERSENAEICTLSSEKRSCLYQFVEKTMDPQLCNMMDLSSQRSCLLTIALGKNDSGICDSITDSIGRDECYLNFVFNTNDETVCANIQNPEAKTSCYAILPTDSKGESQCGLIDGNVQRDSCFKDAAIRNEDIFMCEEIESSISDKNECFGYFINVQGFGVCDTWDDSQEARSWCYYAGVKLGKATCNDISNEYVRFICSDSS